MSNRTIITKGYQYAQVKEGKVKTGKTIYPGYLLGRESGGVLKPWDVAGEAQMVFPLFATENELIGKGVADSYAAGERCYGVYATPGMELYAKLAAAAAAVVYGDLLCPSNDGTLKKAGNYLTDSSGGTANTTLQSIGGTYTQAEVANNFADVAAAINALKVGARFRALEAVDNSAGGAEVFILVEVL